MFDVDSVTRGDLRLLVLDEDMQTLQELSLGLGVAPRVVTWGVVLDQLMIAAPDMPTLYGVVGGRIDLANKVASTNATTTALTVPQGLCTAWQNRIAIAQGQNIFVSDPVGVTGGDVRTFVAFNINSVKGRIYGLHTGADGSLIAVTTEGTFALPAEAATVGIVGSNGVGMIQLSDFSASNFGSTAIVGAALFGLSSKGIVQIGTAERPFTIDDPKMPRYFYEQRKPYNLSTGRLFAWDGRLLASIEQAIWVQDAQGGAWLYPSEFVGTGDMCGVLQQPYTGEPLQIWPKYIAAYVGNFDGQIDLTSDGGTTVVGGFLTIIKTPPSITSVYGLALTKSDTQTKNMIAVRGSLVENNAVLESNQSIVGTTRWGATTEPKQKQYATPSLRGVRFPIGAATDDLTVEICAQTQLSRIASDFVVVPDVNFEGGAGTN